MITDTEDRHGNRRIGRRFAFRRGFIVAALALVAACGSGATVVQGASGDAGPDAAAQPFPNSLRHLYVSLYGENVLAVVQESTGTVADRIPVGKGPAVLVRTPASAAGPVKIYSANWQDSSLSSVDVASRAVKPIPLGSRPWVIAMSPDGAFVYAGLDSKAIAVVSTATDEVVRTLPSDLTPVSIVVSPDSRTLYVAIFDTSTLLGPLGGSLEALAADTGDVVHAAVKVGSTPAWINLAPDGTRVFTLNFTGNNVSVVDTSTFAVSQVPAGSGSMPIIGDVASDGTLAVTDFGTNAVGIFDPGTTAVARTIAIDGKPVGVQLEPDGSHGYVTSFGHSSLSQPLDPTVLLTGSFGGLISGGDGQLLGFDPKAGTLVGPPVALGSGPTSIVVTAN